MPTTARSSADLRLATCLLVAWACLSSSAAGARPTRQVAQRDVRASASGSPSAPVRVVAVEGTQTAWFRLDPPGRDPSPDDHPVGVARWVTGPVDSELPEEGRRVELEVRWIGQDVRLLAAERVMPGEHRVVWREQLPAGGRTVLISVDRNDPSAKILVTETAAGKVRRRSLSRDRGAWQLLSLVEAAGRGVEPHGAARILMPQKAAVEAVGLSMEPLGEDRRSLSLTFADGLSGPSFTFEGRELVGFVWQAGGAVASRIPPKEHARWIRFGAGDEHTQD